MKFVLEMTAVGAGKKQRTVHRVSRENPVWQVRFSFGHLYKESYVTERRANLLTLGLRNQSGIKGIIRLLWS